MSNSDTYYVLVNGSPQGPYTENQLKEMLSNNQISEDTSVWNTNDTPPKFKKINEIISINKNQNENQQRHTFINFFIPWRRFFARCIFDQLIVCIIYIIILIPLVGIEALDKNHEYFTTRFSILYGFLYLLYDAILIGCFGTTIGKYLLKIRIVDKDTQKPIGFLNEVKRFFLIEIFTSLLYDWIISIINLFKSKPIDDDPFIIINIILMIIAYSYYKRHNVTIWDEGLNTEIQFS